MKIEQSNSVSVHLVPPSTASTWHHGIFPSSPPIYINYHENYEKSETSENINSNLGTSSSSSPIYLNYCKNHENFQNHGKSAIWVEREDFYCAELSGTIDGTKTTIAPFSTVESPSNSKSKKAVKSDGRRRKESPLDTEPYLLIGFDTEFKTPDNPVNKDDIKGGRAKYRVLSYQFHAKTSDGRDWSGICCPEGDERMTLPEFIVFVLGLGAREHSIRQLPTRLFLIGHFTRADIPAFKDCRDLKGAFMNIRNTFVTGGNSLSMDVMFEDGNPVTLSIGIRDTMLLTPATSKKLSALGELLNVPKKVLKTDAHDHEWLIRNMDYCRDHHWEMFRDYAITDATIAMLYGEQVIAIYNEIQGERKFPVTLSSIGVDLLTRKLTSNKPPLFNQLLGLEPHTSKQFSKRLGHHVTKKTLVPIIEVDRFAKEATECYHGGRNEQFWFGPCFEDTWTDYDLQNAYPTAMAMIGIPIWSMMYTTNDIDQFQPTTLGYVDVEFEFPPSVRYPVMPVRTDNGIIFPRTGRSRCSAPELFVAKCLGAKLKIHFGLVVPTNSEIRPFADFTKDCIRYRKEAGKKTLKGLFWKEITNSTYGKTAQGLFPKRVYDLREAETKLLPQSDITNPYLAAFITSCVRAMLGELMNGLPADKLVFSCTTDGFLTNATNADMAALAPGPMYREFTKVRKELTGDPSVLEIKHIVSKPLGWRTRGQATLMEGTEPLPDKDGNIVLAKGGIYLPRYLESVKQQNDYIVDLFLNRSPDSIVEVVGSVGIREIMEFDADFVEKTFSKRLGMEYDWKRCPTGIAPDPVTGHLVFNTKPWDSINQFHAMREGWDDYVKNRFTCLKTVDDFRRFASFVEVRTSVTADVKRYLKREDGDLKRLRMAVCAAWKHGTAGISDEQYEYSAQEFSDLLVLCGIPCLKTDVENGKKKPFTPNRVPSTPAVYKAINDLKTMMPTLDADELLFKTSAENLINISVVVPCRFIDELIQQGSG